MKMKTIISTLLLCLFTTISLSSFALEKQQRNADLFTKIEVNNGVDLFITQGTIQSLHVEADASVIDKIVTTVKGGRLTVAVKGKISDKAGTMRVYVVVPKLDEIVASGAVDVNIQTPILSQEKLSIKLSGASELNNGNITTKALSLSLSGASHCGLIVDAESIDANVNGSSDLKMRGKTKKLDVVASGASSVDATGFTYDKSSITSSGASDIKLSKD